MDMKRLLPTPGLVLVLAASVRAGDHPFNFKTEPLDPGFVSFLTSKRDPAAGKAGYSLDKDTGFILDSRREPLSREVVLALYAEYSSGSKAPRRAAAVLLRICSNTR